MSIIGSEVLAHNGRKILVSKILFSTVRGSFAAALDGEPYEPTVDVEGWVVSLRTNKTTFKKAIGTVLLKDLDEFDCQQARLAIDYEISRHEVLIRRLKDRRLEFFPGEMVLKDGTTATNIEVAQRRIKSEADEMVQKLTGVK